MPFTVSHIAAILPFTTSRVRRWFDPAALAIGAIVPDFALFAPDALSYSWSHDLPWGPLTYDLVSGLAVFLIWTVLMRRPLSDLAPGPLRRRLPAVRPLGVIRWGPVVWSLVLGAYNHVLWDTFTHAGRLGTEWIPALDTLIGPLPVFKWLQYGSGVFGFIVLAWWLVRWWRRTPPSPTATTASVTLRRLSWVAVACTLVLAVTVTVVIGATARLSLERIAFLSVTRGGAATVVTVGLCCLVWWIGRSRQRPDPPAVNLDSHL